MNYIDIVLTILLVLSAISGFRKGLIVELASLAALVLGIWGAFEFSHVTSAFLVENLNWKWDHLNIASFIITFIVIVILVHIIGNTVNKIVETVMLGFVNKLAGLVFGIIRTALVLSILLIIFDEIDEDVHILSDKAKEKSQMYEPIRNLVPTIFPFIDFWDDDDDSNDEEPWYEKVV
jgi:membrane protein required for colicin V production